MNNNELLLEKNNGVRIIKINRPKRRNAFSPDIYKWLTEILNNDAKDNSIVVTIITGVGEYFSSGNDLTASAENKNIQEGVKNVRDMVLAFINYPKLLISVVNGPAIGIGATSAALCDIVYASDKAFFDTPFLKLGLCCEAGSSFTFPAILGRSKASEVLILNHKLSAEEAYQFGFVSKIIPVDKIDSFIDELKEYGKLNVNSVIRNKNLITRNFKSILQNCNEAEYLELCECMESEEFMEAIMKFLSRKSKL